MGVTARTLSDQHHGHCRRYGRGLALGCRAHGSCFHSSCRYNVDRDTPTTAATSDNGVLSAIIFLACFAFTWVITVGRPPSRPRARAAASPAWVRSRIKSR